MSLYGTLPRNSIRNRQHRHPLLPLLPPTPPSTSDSSNSSSASSSASSSSTFSSHRSQHSINQFSVEHDPFAPVRSRLSSAYLPNSEYYTPSLVSNISSPLKPLPLPSIISLNSLNYTLFSKDDHSSVLSPTEISDSVTFTESASFDDASSSITISTLPKIKPKLYYASDTLETSRSESLQKRSQPNFYGVEDEDDDEEEDDVDDEGFENSELDFYHMVRREYSVDKYRELRRKQSMSLDSSLFDPAIIGLPLSLTEASSPSNRKSHLSSGHLVRFGYRLSMRIKKLYNKPPVDTQSSDALNACTSAASSKSRIQIRLRQLFQPPEKSISSLGSVWKKKIVVVFNKAFSHSSLNSIGLKHGGKASKNCVEDERKQGSSDIQPRFVRSNSIAGIKKRPLSMTYDLERVTGLKKDKAHMVAAFEQSLSSMTTRLQQLSSSSEVKDCELERLRKTIEVLRQQGGSLVNGVKSSRGDTFGRRKGSFTSDYTDVESPTSIKFNQRQLSTESVNSVSSCGEASKSKKKSKLKTMTGHNASWIRSSFSRAFKKNKTKGGESVGNREFMSDAESGNEQSTRRPSSATGIVGGPDNSRSVPSSPLLSVRSFKTSTSSSSDSKAMDANGKGGDETEGVQTLQKQLREKEMQLTDMRLESLTSTHQLENLKEMLSQMRQEMVTVKQENERLQRLVTHKSLASSASSLTNSTQMAGTLSGDGNCSSARNSNNLDSNSLDSVQLDGILSSPGSNSLDAGSLKPVTLGSGSHTLARFAITCKTNWDSLDALVRKLFKEHLIRVDCHLSLGVTVDSLACYKVGAEQVQRNLQELAVQPTPELLPFGYLVENCHINLQFKSALDSLAFDTLTPKSILNQFLGLLSENRRLIFSGTSGLGKTYLAHKLAEYLVIQKQLTSADESVNQFGPAMTSGAIATFNVDHKNAKELRAYLFNIAEQCESLGQMIGDCPQSPMNKSHLPIVIILDNLHHIDDSLVVDIFNDLYRLCGEKSPYIIGTINQNVTSTQTISEMFHRFHFRMATFSVQTEPVKGFLTRYLRRKWLETEVKYGKTNIADPQLNRIIDWIPRVSIYLNRFLENFFPSQNVSIGPRLFTSCPIDVNGSQIWFTDLWNFSILPFITENLRDLLNKSRSSQGSTTQQMYTRLKEKFIDPTDWVVENYPWMSSGCSAEWSDHLTRLRLEDILEHDPADQSTPIRSGSSASGKFSVSGKPPVAVSINDRIEQVNDPFLEMLIKLKEATEVNNSSHELSK